MWLDSPVGRMHARQTHPSILADRKSRLLWRMTGARHGRAQARILMAACAVLPDRGPGLSPVNALHA